MAIGIRRVRVLVVVLSSVMSVLVWSPIVAFAGVGGSRGDGSVGEVFVPVPVVPFGGHEVVLPGVVSGVVDVAGERVGVAGLPVSLRVFSADGGPVRGFGVRVESLSAERVAGVGGELFGVSLSPVGVVAASVLEVGIDYSGFRFGLGGDWAARLGVVRFECGAERVGLPSCGSGVPVEVVSNDLVAGVLTVRVPVGGVGVSGGLSRPSALVTSGSTLVLQSESGSFAADAVTDEVWDFTYEKVSG